MRRLALASGLCLLAAVWLGPLLDADRASLSAGMLAHMAVVTVAAPLLAIGLSRRPVATTGMRPAFRMISVPVIASLVELVVVWGWHAPSARALVERSMLASATEQANFLAAGMFLWSASLARGREAVGAFALLLTSIHMTLLGALLSLTPRPLYGETDVTCLGFVLDAAQDQQLAGVIMLAMGAIAYLAGGLALLARMLAAEPAAEPL